MKRLSSRFYMAIGLSALVVTSLLLALFAGLVPDREGAQREGRTSLAESVAVSVTVLLSDEDDSRIRQVLNFVVKRNPALLSVGLRSEDGQLRLKSGPHPAAFEGPSDGSSTETHVRVPLLHQGGTWGHAELIFRPLQSGTGLAALAGSPVLMISSMGFVCFCLFYVYLSRTLRHLDPSRVIPGRVRTAFDTLAEGLMVLDPKGSIVLANRAFADVLGADPEKLIGRDAASMGWIPATQNGTDVESWTQMLRGAQAHRNVLLYLPAADGRRRSFMVNGSPVPGAGGKPAGMLVSLDDVTALEEKEIQLRMARDAAEAANRAKSEFLANMSHEIRTPMNAILGFAELLRRGWQTEGQNTQRHLDTILSSGKHLLALINDILDLSKVEAGRLEVERIPCAVHEVVNEVVAIMQVRAQEAGIRLAVDYASALPATVSTDPARLRQIVTNLVGNALKFTQQGGVTVAVHLVEQQSVSELHIEVRDTGIGIAADKVEAIFEPFVQAEASTTRQYGGTGLGLAISRRFARALGGDITASSVPGSGSTFHVTLDVGPISPDAWLQPDALHAATGAGRAAVDRRWAFDGQCVLVVDDGDENRELVRLVLEGAGLRVIEANNGAVALERVAADQPALVLMDVQMPVMDGYEATRHLRGTGHTLPILALTAHAMKGFEKDIEGSGFSGFLTKPVDIDALLDEMGRRLGGRQVAVDPAQLAQADRPVELRAAATTPAFPGTGRAAAPPPVSREPIVSRLAQHPRLARVARTFCLALPGRLESMRAALAAGRMQEMAELAHWLKGAGGTVGYDALFEPARELERHARAGDREALERNLAQIEGLAERLVAPAELPSEVS
jgi:PAS domain S-box-containing protein